MKSPRIMYIYAAFLVLCGLTAFALSGFDGRAVTALIAPTIMAAVMVLMGYMASLIDTKRLIGMIGIHAGMLFPVLFAVMFGRLSYARFTAEGPVLYLATIFALMCVGSIVAFVAILLTRPKPEARG